MLGDRFFLKCGLDGLYLHSKYTGEPVYAYEFSFEGKYSIVQLYGQNATDWGKLRLSWKDASSGCNLFRIIYLPFFAIFRCGSFGRCSVFAK